MGLDYHSVLFFTTIYNIFIVILFFHYTINHLKKWFLTYYILGKVFQTVAIILVGLRGKIPFCWSVEISNLFLISGFATSSFGLLSFDGKFRKDIFYLFAVFIVLFYGSFVFVSGNDNLRIIVQIISSSFFYGIGAFMLFKVNTERFKYANIICVALFIYSIFQIYRAVVIYHIGPSYNFMVSRPIDDWYLIISTFAISFSSIGFLLLLIEADEKIINQKNRRIEEDKLELEALNLTKDKFFSIIAHDLRGPIGTFKTLVEFLLTNFDLTNTKRLIELIKSLHNNASSTFELLENLLLWSKAQISEIIYNPQTIDLHEITETCIAITEEMAKRKGISIYNNVPKEFRLTADFDMTSTVIRNLLSNAIKFTLGSKSIYLSSTKDESICTYSVRDEGIGIKKENLEKIFAPNKHFTTSGTSGEKGSGLGLMLCKDFIEKQGGNIWVDSKAGKGSDFKFTLPV